MLFRSRTYGRKCTGNYVGCFVQFPGRDCRRLNAGAVKAEVFRCTGIGQEQIISIPAAVIPGIDNTSIGVYGIAAKDTGFFERLFNRDLFRFIFIAAYTVIWNIIGLRFLFAVFRFLRAGFFSGRVVRPFRAGIIFTRFLRCRFFLSQIGRASCRERV